MANICSTTIKFYTKGHNEQLDEMHKRFIEIMNGTGKFSWLPISAFVECYYPNEDASGVNCRGEVEHITEIESNDMYRWFEVDTETAWSAKMGVFYKIVKDFYPDVEIAYISEECGMAYYLVYDKTPDNFFFPDQYYIDGCFPNGYGSCEPIPDKYFAGNFGELMDYLQDILPFRFERQETPEDLTLEINYQIAKYVTENNIEEGEDEPYFLCEEFTELAPSEFEFYN